MAATFEQALEVAMELCAEDRVILAHMLFDSVAEEADDDAGASAAWQDEIKRRIDEIRDGTAVTYDADEVMAELRARFG